MANCLMTGGRSLFLAAAVLMAGGTAASAQTKLAPAAQKLYDEAVKVIPGLPVEIFAGAMKEKELTIYRIGHDFPGVVFPEFNKVFPFIEITEFAATVGPLLQRYTAEARSGRVIADVVMNAIYGEVDAIDGEGLVGHYVPTSADKLTGVIRPGAYYPIDTITLCNAYNTNLVSAKDAEGLGRWETLADPKWKGKVALAEFNTGGVITLAYTLVDKGGYTTLGKLVGEQQAKIYPLPQMVERLSAGDVSVAFFANEANLHRLKKAGAPIEWKCPSPGLQLNDFQFIAANAPHPNAARLWVEFLLSKKGQELVNVGLGLGPSRTDVPDQRPAVGQPWYQAPTSLYPYTWKEIDASVPELRSKWDAAVKAKP